MIKAFSLLNGREILGTVVEETDTSYTINNALAIHIVVDERDPSRYGIQFIPVSPLLPQIAEGSQLTVQKQSLSFEPFEPNAEMAAKYKQQVSPILQGAAVSGFNVQNGFTRN